MRSDGVAQHASPGQWNTGLHILGIHTGVADVREGERNDLARVTGIGKDFLIAGHCRVEAQFTAHLTLDAYALTVEDGSVLQNQHSRMTGFLR